MNKEEIESLSVETAISKIIASTERIRMFWTEVASDWSPRESAELLENSRMDRLASLSHSLRLWIEPCAEEDQEGRLILAWANLGILVEGTMTWFLCVFKGDYAKQSMKTKNGFELQPNRLRFEEMTRFFRQHIWTDRQAAEWDAWLTMVRDRRNAVHAFNHREIGSWRDWHEAVIRYHEFIDDLDGQVPYPDASGHYA